MSAVRHHGTRTADSICARAIDPTLLQLSCFPYPLFYISYHTLRRERRLPISTSVDQEDFSGSEWGTPPGMHKARTVPMRPAASITQKVK